MKHYFTAFMLICFASFSLSQNTYEKQWETVLKLEDDGLTKSASELVDVIYAKASSENNSQQRIKSIFFQSKYLQVLKEDSQLKIVNAFKTEIQKANLVTQHLLENILANIYWQYYKQNRWRFQERSKTVQKVDDDFRTWDLETLFAEIHKYFQYSLEDAQLTQKEPLSNYSTILVEEDSSKDYRPTLYDLLSHNALSFYKTPENSITQPAYKFTIDNKTYIAPNNDFVSLKITSKDSVNLQLNALQIYQNLMRFHAADKASKAFVAINIERLDFVKNHASFSEINSELIKTLQTEISSIGNNLTKGLYQYELAKINFQKGSKYNSKKEETAKYQWQIKEALSLCNSVILNYPNSDGAKKCESLKATIIQPNLTLRTEKHIPVNSPSLILVNYKNLNELNFNIYKVSHKQLNKYQAIYRPEEKQDFLKTLNSYKTFNNSLKNENDYQNHSTEVVLPKLNNGLYIIVANTINDVFATVDIQATNLALIETNEESRVIYQIINRINGAPIENAKVKFYYRNNRNRSKELTKSFKTDKNGIFYFEKGNNYYGRIKITVSKNEDTAIFDEGYISRRHKPFKTKDTQYQTFIISDRSIYRPGQTVYFKGIATQTNDKNTSVLEDETITATLHDVNGQELNKQDFKTNAYGSFHGEFILPASGLTGNYHIKVSSRKNTSLHYLSVEEYKRPKFEVTFNPVTETFKINDSITVNGNAIAFAGSNISDAKVVYRVKRQVRYPGWYYWHRASYNSEAQEITFGETTTDADGNFDITFKAIPDPSASKDTLPVFNYEVTADVTDINGETRSTKTTVNVGYHALLATIGIASRIDKSKKETEIKINTNNLNGEFVPAKGTLKIYKLGAPNNVLRPRPWQSPDYKSLTKSTFKDKFPHVAFDNESDFRQWKKGDLVFKTKFNTEISKTATLKRIKKWASGKYVIELNTEDKFGKDVTDKSYFDVFAEDDKTVADNAFFEIATNQDQYTPNSKAIVIFGSAVKDATITFQIEKQGEIVERQIHKINNERKSINLPITKNDIGGFVIHYTFVALNSVKSGTLSINVPYPKTDLQIETATFRDRLQPGQDETWSFKIKGAKGDKVAAEVLASMYDASLDEFKSNDWSFNPINRPNYYQRTSINTSKSFATVNFRRYNNFTSIPNYFYQRFDRLDWFGFYFGRNNIHIRGMASRKVEAMAIQEESESLDEVIVVNDQMAPNANNKAMLSGQVGGVSVPIGSAKPGESADIILRNENKPIIIRKNLQETAFFFPQLTTDKDGNVSFNFKAPEALTKWKLQLLAHTKSLESAVAQFEAVTQKELMVLPNTPRFLRQGDEIIISTKIANLTDKGLNGIARLKLLDAINNQDITTKLISSSPLGKSDEANFSVDAKGNTQVSWTLKIPENIQAVQYTITAQSEDFSDGEQSVLPVLTNRMLVTETLPMWVKSNETRTFTLDKLASTGSATESKTLKHHQLTLEITSNPAWYAVQALPYLMEYPYDCNEQTFSRYYANALAQHIVKSNPKIEAVFNQWKSTNSDALISNLEKNQELKSLLIQETPWLRDAQSETEQKKRIALLFDLNKMNNELQSALQRLKNNQHTSGAWPWFNGGFDNRYITQHIISGFGHLKKLNVITSDNEKPMINKAIKYLDREFVKEYKDLTKYNKDSDLSKDHLSHMQLQYLYMRSFYPEIKMPKEVSEISDYYKRQIQTFWLKRSLYDKGLMALIMYRAGDKTTTSKILKSLKENSITSEELGMYWKENTASWYWHRAPIETQALLIEAFSEVGYYIQSEMKNLEDIDNLKIWLLKNKQTNKWETTKATTEAVYALLLQGNDWLAVTDAVNVTVGNEKIDPNTLDNSNVEAGTGYYKTSWNSNDIKPEQATVIMSKKDKGIAWGALYWQYFEDLDKITSAETPLRLNKRLFLKQNTNRGEEIKEITEDTKLNVGDLVRVRIELRSDRDMEFLHLKDMRAAGLEPINVLSQYKWQEGLGYYESTKDAATNFFIDYLPKGIYVFEYDLRVNNSGEMSNGITTVESMYAPEFRSHSEGKRIHIK